MVELTRRSTLLGLSFFLYPAQGSTAPAAQQKQDGELVQLERPAAFEITSQTGTLKETTQRGQELIWHAKGKSSDRRFQLTNISIAFLRTETGGELKMTFSCNVTSFGHSVEDAKLNATVRTKGGGALYTWSLAIAVKCGDNNQPLSPLTQQVPSDLAANVFNNVSTVEVAETTEPNFPGVTVQSCG